MTQTAESLMMTKICVGCGKTKPVTAFYATPREPDGWTCRCTQCIRIDSRRFRRERAEREAREALARRRRPFVPI